MSDLKEHITNLQDEISRARGVLDDLENRIDEAEGALAKIAKEATDIKDQAPIMFGETARAQELFDKCREHEARLQTT